MSQDRQPVTTTTGATVRWAKPRHTESTRDEKTTKSRVNESHPRGQKGVNGSPAAKEWPYQRFLVRLAIVRGRERRRSTIRIGAVVPSTRGIRRGGSAPTPGRPRVPTHPVRERALPVEDIARVHLSRWERFSLRMENRSERYVW